MSFSPSSSAPSSKPSSTLVTAEEYLDSLHKLVFVRVRGYESSVSDGVYVCEQHGHWSLVVLVLSGVFLRVASVMFTFMVGSAVVGVWSWACLVGLLVTGC
jgi:hypothetical protein